jgi:hypothetical protein
MQQDALATINISDFGLAGSGGHETWVISEDAMGTEAAYINDIWSLGASKYREFDALLKTINGQYCFLVSHKASLFILCLTCATENLSGTTIEGLKNLSITLNA